MALPSILAECILTRRNTDCYHSFVSIGHPGRRFAAEDPKPHDLLPVDDAAWDNGMVTCDDSSTLSSPLSSNMSKFALVAQAAGLLGQVLKHVSAHATDWVLHHEEGVQLDRTLHALISASEVNNSPYCDQRSICYSALIALHEPQVSSNSGFSIDPDHCHYASSVSEAVSKTVAATVPQYLPGLGLNSEKVSVWGLHLIYQASVVYMRLNREANSSNYLEVLKTLQQALRVLDVRWKAAGVYLQVLEAWEVMGIC